MSDRILFDKIKDASYRNSILESILSSMLKEQSTFDSFLISMLEHTMDNLSMFDNKYFRQRSNEDYLCDLILPSVAKIWLLIFIKPSILLKDKKLELYKSLFNIDDYLLYLLNSIIENKDILNKFHFIDRNAQLVELIVNNFIGMLFDKAYNSTDIVSDLRDSKLKKII